MSSLIFCTEPEQAFIATDTLATLVDGNPFRFTTKAYIVPHLKMVIGGTGLGGVIDAWAFQVNHMVVRDVDHLDYHTRDNLNRIWADVQKKFSIPDDLTVTLYHFGFSLQDNTLHAYAYRSANDFRSERLEYGLRVKPACSVPENYEFPTDIKKMMEEQRVIQAALPTSDRVYIGGAILVHHLTRDGFSVYELDRFDDYAATERAIYENFARA
jgi:hypothetical protein